MCRDGEAEIRAAGVGERWRVGGLNVPESVLYDAPREVIPGVWSAIGATAPGTYANSGHNNNLSFVVTDDGVLVVNAGDNYLLAKALHDEIKKITDQPVKYVVLENGQGHAMLGSNYWQAQGATVIAHEDAAKEIEEQSFALLQATQERIKEKAEGTQVVMPDETFEDRMVIELGGAEPGTGHDQVAADGGVTLAGVLELTLIDGFEPDYLDSFSIITCGGRTGIFGACAAAGRLLRGAVNTNRAEYRSTGPM